MSVFRSLTRVFYRNVWKVWSRYFGGQGERAGKVSIPRMRLVAGRQSRARKMSGDRTWRSLHVFPLLKPRCLCLSRNSACTYNTKQQDTLQKKTEI